jgi:nitrogen regulatory protein PII
MYRSVEFRVQPPKLRLEIAADNWVVEGAVEAIMRAESTGHSGQIGDCKVLVIELDGYFASVMANEDRWLSQPEGEDPW